jgi:hypothetical protein
VSVGIIVFASVDQAPTNGKKFKVLSGNNILVVLDEASDAPIAAAYSYAKYLALGLLNNAQLDFTQLKDVVSEIERSLDFESQINRETGIASGAVARLASIALRAREDISLALSKLKSDDKESQQ